MRFYPKDSAVSESVARKERRCRYSAALFFALLLVFGWFVHRDYGISWDELAERRTGLWSVCCALSPGRTSFSEIREMIGGDCYYGMGFQHLLLLAEHLCGGEPIDANIKGNSGIWAMRHLLNFVFVWFGLIALFFSGKLLWRRTFPALLPVFLFLLVPRFWAESFYNCKDMVFLSAVMIGGYFLLRMMKMPSAVNVVFCAVSIAFAASVRLIGGVFFFAGAAVLLTASGVNRKTRLIRLLILSAVSAAALIAFYPIAWSSPFRFFLGAVQHMRAHPWNGGILFFGREYLASQVPWYYVPGWMAVTLPVPLMVLFFCGHGRIMSRIFGGSRRPAFLRRSAILFAACFYLLLLAVITCCRTCYNGWRQFYFLAWPMLFIATEGLLRLLRPRRKACLRPAVKIALAAWVLSTLGWMVYVHPYQNLFFNVLAGPPNGKFELDYWQVASRDALRHISRRAAERGETAAVALNTTNYLTVCGLEKHERPYVRIVPQEDFCRYFIFHFPPQWHPGLGGRPFRVNFPTGVRVEREVGIRSSLFLHPVFVYRIYEFFPLRPMEGSRWEGK